MPAAYFTAETLRFLSDLAKHNDRDWFAKNKERYEQDVKEPMLRFIADLGPELKKIAPHYVADARAVGGSMMRIYRDVRFSKDKSPYKTNIAAHFGHVKARTGAPAFYLHIAPGNSAVGAGLWQPEPPELKMVRDAIVKDTKKWLKITEAQDFRSACGFMGESLKRPPAGYDSEHPAIEDLKRKDFAANMPLMDKQVTSPALMRYVTEGFKTTVPFTKFLGDAIGLPL